MEYYTHIASTVDNEYKFYMGKDKKYYFSNEGFRGKIGRFDTLAQLMAFVQYDVEFRDCYNHFLNS